jgi:hypothetical protein
MAGRAKAAFAGLPGLEAPPVTSGSHLGETGTIIAADYTNKIGLLGGHRSHHTREDEKQTTDPELASQVSAACRTLLTQSA